MLNKYIDNLDGLISRLSPPQKKALLKEIGQEIRRRNARRIEKNIEPEGYKYAPRKGDRWKMRPLRQGEQLAVGQKFSYFKERDLELKNVIDRGDRFVGREVNGLNAGYRASGFLKKWIYLKGARASARLFPKMPRARWLKYKASSAVAEVGFWGLVGSIASEHQIGAKKLTARPLIGFSADDLNYIEEAIIKHLALALGER